MKELFILDFTEARKLPKEIRKCGKMWWLANKRPGFRTIAYCVYASGHIGSCRMPLSLGVRLAMRTDEEITENEISLYGIDWINISSYLNDGKTTFIMKGVYELTFNVVEAIGGRNMLGL